MEIDVLILRPVQPLLDRVLKPDPSDHVMSEAYQKPRRDVRDTTARVQVDLVGAIDAVLTGIAPVDLQPSAEPPIEPVLHADVGQPTVAVLVPQWARPSTPSPR